MITTCPKCKSKLSIDESMIDSRVQCAGCRHFFIVPVPPGYTPPPAPQPLEPEASADQPKTAPTPQAAAGPKTAPTPKPEKPATVTKVHRGRDRASEQPPAGGGQSANPSRGPAAVGKILVLVGLALVLLAKGGDTIGTRAVDRAKARKTVAQNEFNDGWESKLEAAKPEERAKLQQEKRKEEADLAKAQWRQLDRAARDAQVDRDIHAYWLAWTYVGGSIVLVAGLLFVGFYGTGAERMVCLIMIAIITFSLYVGGFNIKAG